MGTMSNYRTRVTHTHSSCGTARVCMSRAKYECVLLDCSSSSKIMILDF